MVGLDLNTLTSNAVTVATAVCASLGAFAVRWGSVQSRLDQMDEARKVSVDSDEKITDKLNGLNVTLERICVALWGIDGSNGLRGEFREMKKGLDELRNEINEFRGKE